MDNRVTALEEKWAYSWFFIAGTVAIGLGYFLATVDQTLTESDREVVLNKTLKEVRSAQASYETRNLDKRLLVTELLNK